MLPQDRIVFRRGDAAMKIFNASGAQVGGPQYGFVHDAYHPLPAQLGEGGVGSGILVSWREPTPTTDRTVVHAIALDDAGRIAAWHYHHDASTHKLSGRETWTLTTDAAGVTVAQKNGPTWRIDAGDAWMLTRA